MKHTDLRARVEQTLEATKTDLSRREKKLRELLKEAERAEDIFSVGRVNLLLSACYFTLGNRNSIFPYAVKAVSTFESLGNRNMLASSYNILGLAYVAQGDYQHGVEYYNRALATIRGMKAPIIRRDVILSNIAECYYHMGEFQISAQILENCIAVISSVHSDDHISAVTYSINLSDDLESMGRFDEALEVLDRARPHLESLDRDVLKWGYYFRRCCVLYKIGRHEEAASFADLGIQAVRSGYDSYEFHRDYEKIAMEELAMGDLARALRFSEILSAYENANAHTIDLIISKRVQAKILLAQNKQEEALALFRELSDLYIEFMREQTEMQFASYVKVAAASKEIAKLLQSVRATEALAERDAFTGMRNRASMVSTATRFIQEAREKGKMLGAIFVDIDYFKEYNDTYGHAAGDSAIEYVAKVCMAEEKRNVCFFRYGGDEFFAIVLDHKDKQLQDLGLRISERVREAAFEHIHNPNGQLLTVSIGLVNVNMRHSDMTLLDFIKITDKTLYHAKDRGKNTVFACKSIGDSEIEYRRISSRSDRMADERSK